MMRSFVVAALVALCGCSYDSGPNDPTPVGPQCGGEFERSCDGACAAPLWSRDGVCTSCLWYGDSCCAGPGCDDGRTCCGGLSCVGRQCL